MSENNQSIELIIGGNKQTKQDLIDMGDFDETVEWKKWSDKEPTGLVRLDK